MKITQTSVKFFKFYIFFLFSAVTKTHSFGWTLIKSDACGEEKLTSDAFMQRCQKPTKLKKKTKNIPIEFEIQIDTEIGFCPLYIFILCFFFFNK